jgi:hypothetical protein
MGPAHDAILGVLNLGGGSGTAPNIAENFDTNRDQLLRDLPDDVEDVNLKTVDIDEHLRTLEDHRLVDYMGHGEYQITNLGRDYLDGSHDFEGKSITRTQRDRYRDKIENAGPMDYLQVGLLGTAIIAVLGLFLYIAQLICKAGLAPLLVTGIILPLLTVTVFLHMVDRAKTLNKFLITKLGAVEDNASTGSIDASAAAVANSFRPAPFLLLVLLLVVGVYLETTIGLGTQFYGLAFDLFGGVFLAIQAINSTSRRLRSSGKDMPWDDFEQETAKVTDGIWGVAFLITGFSIQALSQIPWTKVLPALPFC